MTKSQNLVIIKNGLNEIIDYCRIAEDYYFNFLLRVNALAGSSERLRVLTHALELPDEIPQLITKLAEASPMPIDPQERTSEARDFELKVNDVLDTLDWYIEEENRKKGGEKK